MKGIRGHDRAILVTNVYQELRNKIKTEWKKPVLPEATRQWFVYASGVVNMAEINRCRYNIPLVIR